MNKLNYSKYTYKEKVKREVQDTIKIYTDLFPKMELHTFNDGVQRNLISLNGTIKVYYISQTYNIPICVYLTESHPYNSPVCYVRPTPTMQIKASNHVDAQGRVYLPYITDWIADKSDLQGLLSIMQIEFGEHCPVFSKAANTSFNPPMPHTNNYYPGAGYPSYPSANMIGSGWGANVSNPSPYPVSSASSAVSNPYMPGIGNQYRPPINSVAPIGAASVATGWNSNGGINDNVLRMSILSAVEDKVHRHYRDIFAQFSAELEILECTNRDLRKGGETVSRMIRESNNEIKTVEKVQQELEVDNCRLQDSLSKCENEEDLGINYDEVVEGSAPLYKQLFTLYVEEQSIEDVLYFMGEGIGKGVIDIETFLKRVRELSRKQFVLRATVKKCREKAGLPDV